MPFRQLPDATVDDLVGQLQYIQHNRAVKLFVQDIWGNEAYQVLIQPDNSNNGCSIKQIEVTNDQSDDILPDFTLPFWQDVFKEDPDFFDGCVTFQGKHDRVMEYLKYESAVYSDYSIEVPYSEQQITLSELGTTQYPELYRREG